MSGEPTVTPEDAANVAQRAHQRLGNLESQIEDLTATVDGLEDELAAAQVALEQLLDDREYEDLDFDDKVARVRQWALEHAQAGRSKTIYYDDVVERIFADAPATKPSAAHAYDLMKAAADRPGFTFHDEPRAANKNKRVTVDPETAKASLELLSANKASAEVTD